MYSAVNIPKYTHMGIKPADGITRVFISFSKTYLCSIL